jgi:hypothetical protein
MKEYGELAALKVVVHVPLPHVPPHHVPHPPQLLVSVCSLTHVPEQHDPPVHAVASVTATHVDVLLAGWQLSHWFIASVVPAA